MTPDPRPFAIGPDDPRAAGLLCLHGLCGTPWDLREIAEDAAAAGLRCVGPLLPGHGSRWEELARTPREAWVASALGAFDALADRHDRVYVAGLSMGGVLALSICEQRPVAGAALMATPLRLGWLARSGSRLLRGLLPSVERLPGIVEPRLRDAHPGYRRMPLAAVRQLVALQREVHADLAKVQAPLLMIYSRADATVSPRNAALIAAGVSSADVELAWLERSGHVLTADVERAEVIRRIRRFLGGPLRAD